MLEQVRAGRMLEQGLNFNVEYWSSDRIQRHLNVLRWYSGNLGVYSGEFGGESRFIER